MIGNQRELSDLLPQSVPNGTDLYVDLSELPELSEPVTTSMAESVSKFGVIQRITLTQDNEGRYIILDGRRRIVAARQAGLTSIPARLFPSDALNPAVVTILMNEQRSPNPIAELDAIIRLMSDGYTPEQIRAATGIPLWKVHQRLRLTKLAPPLQAAVRNREMSLGAALDATHLSAQAQARLSERAEAGQRIGQAQVREERTAQRQQEQALVAAALPQVTEEDNWQRAMSYIDAALAILETGTEPQVRLREMIMETLAQYKAGGMR